MDVEQEKQCIKNAKKVVIILQGIKIKISKSTANKLLFEKPGWTIDDPNPNLVVLSHQKISLDADASPNRWLLPVTV